MFVQSKNNELNIIAAKLPTNDIIAKEILQELNNKTTKVIFDKDIKNSYYVYFKDTIYIADTAKNKTYRRICLIAHECIHSIQSKSLQNINFIISNIELIAFIIALIVIIILKNTFPLYVYVSICFLSMLPRAILELDAIKNSVKVAKEYIDNKLERKEVNCLVTQYEKQTKVLLPIAIISLFFEKIIRILIIFLITVLL